MNDWQKLRRLSTPELLSLFQAATLFPAVVVCQRWIHMRRLHAGLSRLSKAGRAAPNARAQHLSANDIARLVRVAARRGIVRPSCLQHALVLWTLLRSHGCDAAIHFGVRKNADALEAHAWVELEGFVLNDAEDVGDRFFPFKRPVLSGEAKLP